MNDATQSERKKITRRAGIVAAGTLLSRFLGLGRDAVLAAAFSRGATDAFMIAFQLPNLLRQLLAEGAVATAVLPVLTQIREREGEDAAKRYFSAIRGLSLTALVVVTLLGIWAAPWLVDIFAPGFRADPEQFERTVTLAHWVFPYIFFMGTGALGVAALNTHERFVVTSFSPALLNVSFIAFALVLPSVLGARGQERILAMAVGALVGGVLQMVSQWPSLRAIGYFDPPRFDLAHPGVRESLRRIAPTLFGIGVYYIDVIVGRRLLSELGEGPISYFGFALRVCDFPQGIFVMALQTATLPSLSVFVARRDFTELGRTFAFSMRLALFVGIPASVLLAVLAEPIVSLLFQRGAFDLESTRETARALIGQGAGVFLVAGIRQLVAVFFALGDTRTPVIVSALDLCVFVGVAILLRDSFGHVGVSWAVSAASLAQFGLLWFFLHKRVPELYTGEVLRSAFKTLLASALAAVVTFVALRFVGITAESGAWLRVVPALVGTTLFGATFLLTCRALKSEELTAIVEPLRTRLSRRRA